LRDNVRDRTRCRLHRFRAGCAAQAPISEPVSGEVYVDHRDVFSLDIFPNVCLGPMQQGMNSDVGSGIKISLVLVPEFRRLILKVPFKVLIPRRKIALFRSSPFLISSDADDHCMISTFLNDGLQSVSLEQSTA